LASGDETHGNEPPPNGIVVPAETMLPSGDLRDQRKLALERFIESTTGLAEPDTTGLNTKARLLRESLDDPRATVAAALPLLDSLQRGRGNTKDLSPQRRNLERAFFTLMLSLVPAPGYTSAMMHAMVSADPAGSKVHAWVVRARTTAGQVSVNSYSRRAAAELASRLIASDDPDAELMMAIESGEYPQAFEADGAFSFHWHQDAIIASIEIFEVDDLDHFTQQYLRDQFERQWSKVFGA
jgi:hypothetical protein